MQPLNLPTYSFNIKSEGGRKYIFDPTRKKFVVLTPEEWVRQNFIRYLNSEKNYPLPLMSVERGFLLYQVNKRTDILLHNRKGEAISIVECKSPDVKITTEVFDQIIRYNLNYKLSILMVTNGIHHYCCKLNYDNNTAKFIEVIPDFETLIAD
jgi:hypothetical protein